MSTEKGGSAQATLDYELLLKLRVVVARYGEMDNARWWNTNGQLGPLGASVLRRGFPRTYRFAAARGVFAVAADRCEKLFGVPSSATLWHLPASIEEQFDARWEMWLDDAVTWEAFFAQVQAIKVRDLAAVLEELGFVSAEDRTAASRMKRSAEGRAVPLSRSFAADDDTIRQLALGFSKGEPAHPAVPYAIL
ncbi:MULTISPECIES: BrxE family protein [unclassified Anaeromyxobacter]|uniref:BrxE family protein n=1 Tax=unclassified Anaeromyxobacter TaxID=2620896 RepID=UPI001F55DEA5|nr:MULTISPECIES: BrxE family protein [unclassified Anaeromyxobacter]